MAKSVKLTVYLIKEGIEKSALLKKDYTSFELEGIGHFFTETSVIKTPSWLDSFFLSKIKFNSLKVASSKGILLVPLTIEDKKVCFVVSFGAGRHMLTDDVVEERFGLRVTLNSINSSLIRSIEKSTLGAISKSSKEQLTKASTARDFGIDIEQDLVKTVTGKSKIESLGKTITGVDSLNISPKVNISSIVPLLKTCYKQYNSEEYLKEFDWIDKIKEIKNKKTIENLNAQLLEKLNSKDFENIWMAVPEIIDWNDLAGFKYLPRQQDFSDDIYIEAFIESFNTGISDLSQIKTKHVTAFSASQEGEMVSWNAYKCLYGEFIIDSKQYILNNSKWYEIENDFVVAVNSTYSKIALSNIELPEYDHENEGAYNEYVANSNDDYLLMDKNEVMHGGGSNKVEFCDIYTNKKHLIHIKHYGASSILSHLFLQGLNSAEYFYMDSDFRKKLNAKLPTGWKLQNPNSKIDAHEYEVVFGIISNNDDERPRIPFFSKVSVKNAKRRLDIMGFNVSLKRIKSVRK